MFALLMLLPLAAVLFAHWRWGLRFPDMTRDVAAIGKLHPLAGFLSSLGILAWWTAVGVWAFAHRLFTLQEDQLAARAAGQMALLSAYLALDDLFQLHEALAPQVLGVPQLAVLASIGGAATFVLVRNPALWRAVAAPWLFAALLLLAASVLVDTVLERSFWRLGEAIYFAEDGLKWLGIGCWAAFAWQWCLARALPPR